MARESCRRDALIETTRDAHDDAAQGPLAIAQCIEAADRGLDMDRRRHRARGVVIRCCPRRPTRRKACAPSRSARRTSRAPDEKRTLASYRSLALRTRTRAADFLFEAGVVVIGDNGQERRTCSRRFITRTLRSVRGARRDIVRFGAWFTSGADGGANHETRGFERQGKRSA